MGIQVPVLPGMRSAGEIRSLPQPERIKTAHLSGNNPDVPSRNCSKPRVVVFGYYDLNLEMEQSYAKVSNGSGRAFV